MLRFMGLQRAGHDWVTELNWTEGKTQICFMILEPTPIHVVSDASWALPYTLPALTAVLAMWAILSELQAPLHFGLLAWLHELHVLYFLFCSPPGLEARHADKAATQVVVGQTPPKQGSMQDAY